MTSRKRHPFAIRLLGFAAIIIGAVLVGVYLFPTAYFVGGLAGGLSAVWWLWSAGPVDKNEKLNG